MNSFEFSEATSDEIAGLKSEYLSTLSAPLDGMWEAFADMATKWLFLLEGEPVGYAAVNGNRQILQFFLRKKFEARELFIQLIKEQDVTGAIVPTCDPSTVALALDQQKSVSVNAIMYHMQNMSALEPAKFPVGSDFQLVTGGALDQAVEFAHKTLGASEEWLSGYFGNLVDREELFSLQSNGELIATGECRVSDCQKGIADVGMVVGKSHRRSGIATNVLRALSHHARSKGLRPICSTETNNLGAQKAISRAGFISQHRILEITF